MAQKRMVDKKISVSEQVANLPILAQLIFTWSVPHADDVGFLPHSSRSLRAMIVPMLDITATDFQGAVEAIVKEGLWKQVEYEKSLFYVITKFHEHQTIKKDRQPQLLIKFPLDKDPKTSWSTIGTILESLGIQMENNGFQMASELNRTELNRTELKVVSDLFDIFYKKYPNKKSKKKAQERFETLFAGKTPEKKKELFSKMITGLDNAILTPQWKKDKGQFVPHPSTWLNQARWEDEVEIIKPKEVFRP